jgi:hypothetical protein
VLGVAVGVHRVLAAAEELRWWPSTSWAWSNPRLVDHDHGLIGVRSMFVSFVPSAAYVTGLEKVK